MITEWLADVIAQRIRPQQRCINTLQMLGTDEPNTEFLICHGQSCVERQCPACEGRTYLGDCPLDYCPICKGFGIVAGGIADDVEDMILLHRAGNLTPEVRPYSGGRLHWHDSEQAWISGGGRFSRRELCPTPACVAEGPIGEDLG